MAVHVQQGHAESWAVFITAHLMALAVQAAAGEQRAARVGPCCHVLKLTSVESAGTGLESSDDEGSADAAAAEGDDAGPATAASAAAKRLRKKRDKNSKKKRKLEGQEPAQEAGDSASKKSRLKKRRIEGAVSVCLKEQHVASDMGCRPAHLEGQVPQAAYRKCTRNGGKCPGGGMSSRAVHGNSKTSS